MGAWRQRAGNRKLQLATEVVGKSAVRTDRHPLGERNLQSWGASSLAPDRACNSVSFVTGFVFRTVSLTFSLRYCDAISIGLALPGDSRRSYYIATSHPVFDHRVLAANV